MATYVDHIVKNIHQTLKKNMEFIKDKYRICIQHPTTLNEEDPLKSQKICSLLDKLK